MITVNKIFSSYLFSDPEEKKIIKNLNMILKEHFYYLLLWYKSQFDNLLLAGLNNVIDAIHL